MVANDRTGEGSGDKVGSENNTGKDTSETSVTRADQEAEEVVSSTDCSPFSRTHCEGCSTTEYPSGKHEVKKKKKKKIPPSFTQNPSEGLSYMFSRCMRINCRNI